jgi:hypothetical protein
VVGDFLQAAEGFVDRLGVRECFYEVGVDNGDVASLLEEVCVLAANALAEVESGALGEWV